MKEEGRFVLFYFFQSLYFNQEKTLAIQADLQIIQILELGEKEFKNFSSCKSN